MLLDSLRWIWSCKSLERGSVSRGGCGIRDHHCIRRTIASVYQLRKIYTASVLKF